MRFQHLHIVRSSSEQPSVSQLPKVTVMRCQYGLFCESDMPVSSRSDRVPAPSSRCAVENLMSPSPVTKRL